MGKARRVAVAFYTDEDGVVHPITKAVSKVAEVKARAEELRGRVREAEAPKAEVSKSDQDKLSRFIEVAGSVVMLEDESVQRIFDYPFRVSRDHIMGFGSWGETKAYLEKRGCELMPVDISVWELQRIVKRTREEDPMKDVYLPEYTKQYTYSPGELSNILKIFRKIGALKNAKLYIVKGREKGGSFDGVFVVTDGDVVALLAPRYRD